MIFNFVLAYIAGLVSILSPCVLPLLPIILVGSTNAHKRGPLFLTAGLVTSFTLFGILIATVGLSIGLTTTNLQIGSSILMILFGVIMVYKPFYEKFSSITSGSTSGLNSKIATMNFDGLKGQYLLGFLLGAVWGPCVGPTLGAAISLASQGEQIAYASLIMFTFAIGIGTPVLIMGLSSQKAMHKIKARLMKTSGGLKAALGWLFIIIGVAIISGGFAALEQFFLDEVLPQSFVNFLYSF